MNDGKILTITSLGETTVDTRVRGLSALTAEQARTLTTQIQRTSVRLWLLVTEAHDRKAHLALGYDSWADYVKAELNMSESRSYQFLDTGHVMKALASSGVNIEAIQPPPTRVIARIKDRLTDVRKVAAEANKKGEDVDKALRAMAREPRRPAAPPAEPGEPEAIKAEGPPKTTRGAQQVSCPACAGTGRVTQTVANRLLKMMRAN